MGQFSPSSAAGVPATQRRNRAFVGRQQEWCLFVEPPVLAAIGVEDAVGHQRHVLYIGLPACAAAGVEDDWAGEFLGELALDRPKQPLPLLLVALARLLLDHLVDLGIAIAVPIEARPAAVEEIEDRIGV